MWYWKNSGKLKHIKLSHPSARVIGKIQVPGSKSEANRLLLLRQLYFPELEITGLSSSRDTQILQRIIGGYKSNPHLDAQDAGTAMRFTTAFLASQPGKWRLHGSERMHERPIGILVEALRQLGAKINYLQKQGFPPLEIEGKNLEGGEIDIDGSQSSQFISALMMIGPAMAKGLKIHVPGFSVSTPYIYLTANIMRKLGLRVTVLGEEVIVPALELPPEPPEVFGVEPDWSAASYWYLIALLADKAEIYLPGFHQYSLQGDSFVANLFAPLGVDSHFIGAGFRLKKSEPKQTEFDINLIHNPDLAQTMAVAFAAKGMKARIKGLQTLRIKETDRLQALKTELEKTGAVIEIGDDYLIVKSGIKEVSGVSFKTYHDHRMAMALAPLALLGEIEIEDPQTVEKSYGSFWEDLEKVKFRVSHAKPT